MYPAVLLAAPVCGRLLILLNFLISQPELNLKTEKPDRYGNEDVEQLVVEGSPSTPVPRVM